MSSSSRTPRRSTSSSSSNGREVEIEEFMMKLQQLIPQLKRHGSNTKISEETLKEACKHIKRLHRQVEELSSTLSHLLLNDHNITAAAAADIADLIQNIIISSSN